jgi:hypothetical protein
MAGTLRSGVRDSIEAQTSYVRERTLLDLRRQQHHTLEFRNPRRSRFSASALARREAGDG